MDAKTERILERLERAGRTVLRARERTQSYPIPYDEEDWETLDELREELDLNREGYINFARRLRHEEDEARAQYDEVLKEAMADLKRYEMGSAEAAEIAQEITRLFLLTP